jgi:hypothetical protein
VLAARSVRLPQVRRKRTGRLAGSAGKFRAATMPQGIAPRFAQPGSFLELPGPAMADPGFARPAPGSSSALPDPDRQATRFGQTFPRPSARPPDRISARTGRPRVTPHPTRGRPASARRRERFAFGSPTCLLSTGTARFESRAWSREDAPDTSARPHDRFEAWTRSVSHSEQSPKQCRRMLGHPPSTPPARSLLPSPGLDSPIGNAVGRWSASMFGRCRSAAPPSFKRR